MSEDKRPEYIIKLKAISESITGVINKWFQT
jgi:hypothetical protein